MFLFLTESKFYTDPKFIGGINLLAIIIGVVVFLIKTDNYNKIEKAPRSPIRDLAILSIMAAVSSVAMLLSFEIIPSTSFLKLEFSVLVIFLVFIWFDFKSAILVSVITNLINYLIKGGLVPFMDQGINFLATMIFLIPFVFVFRKYCFGGKRKELHCEINLPISKLIITGVVAVLLTTVVMLVINMLIVIPLYNNLLNNAVDGILKGISDNRFVAILSTFGLFNIIHWGSIAVVIVLLGPRLVKVRQSIR